MILRRPGIPNITAPLILRCTTLATVLSLTVPVLTAQSLGAEGDERGIWDVWKQHEAAPSEHEAVVAACQAFATARPRDPYTAVADTLAGWHLLKLGRTADAVARMEPYTERDTEPLARGAHMVAASWLTRLDRDQIKKALQFYYRREIGYPRNLRELAEYKGLPESLAFQAKDRWGNPWEYRLTGFSKIANLLNQKHQLRSSKLGDGSDLARALALPYGSGIQIKPVAVQPGLREGLELLEIEVLSDPGEETATQNDSAQRAHLAIVGEGTLTDGAFLAHIGKHILVVCDRYHWKLFAKPPAR